MPQIVGRETELTLLEDVLRPGSARCAVVIAGDAGIGKTSIIRAGLEEASAASLRVRLARPAEAELELPYAGLGDLFGDAESDLLRRLPRPQRAAVEAALGREAAAGAVDQHALARGVLELLRLDAADGNLLVVVDDVQWLDRPTVSAMTFALRRLGAVPLRVLAAVRTEGDASPMPFGLEEWDGVRRLTVAPLPATELGAVVRERTGEQLTRPQLVELLRVSGGNTMFALELVRSPHTTVESLPHALAARLRGLKPAERAPLSAAAAALRPTSELLQRAGIDREAMTAALRTGVIQLDGERLRFAHPLLANAAYELLLPEERRELHARLAAAADDPVERGHHVARSASAPDESAAELLDGAAEEAGRLGDHAGAARFLVRGIELSADRRAEATVRRELRAAVELELGGDAEASAALARSLVDRLPPGPDRARARLHLVGVGWGPDVSIGDAVPLIEVALDEADRDDELRAGLHLVLSELACGDCRLSAATRHARAAIDLAERSGAEQTLVASLAMLGFAESMERGGVPECSREAVARWDGTVHLQGNSPRMWLGCVCMGATSFEEAAALFHDEIAFAVERGLEPVEVIARGHLSETLIRAGHWSDAHQNARLALEHARQAASKQVIAAASCVVATIEALLGRHDAAQALAASSLAAAEETGDFWWTLYSRGVLGLVSLADGEAEAAVEMLEPGWSLMVDRGLGDLSLFPVAQVLGEACAATGRLESAVAIAAALRACAVGEQPWCRAMAGRCEALVLSARGDHIGARAAIASALEAHAALPEPFEHARTVHIAGRIEHAARNWGAARTTLTEALERFDALGAARWAEKAATDLARIPGRRRATGAELTVREREVAELVAAGLSNREVAARLFVSTRTVEANLSKIYAKLGLRSRTELARRLKV
ncbi:MAG TPA: AAA family ATPase [Gaiellaceae bacterium]|nr:AAA family ATPase [Gaiellaceae bacterium]